VLGALDLTTILCRPPLGFLVDRIGAAPVLIAGRLPVAAAIAAVGLAPDRPAPIACAIATGFGNAVDHPADCAILAARVRADRVGRAFAVHTFGGCPGFAAAPITIVALTGLAGWRTALALAGGAGLGMGLLLSARRRLLSSPPGASGRVFGFVTTGLDPGGPVAAPFSGVLVDAGRPELVFPAVALVSLVTVAMVTGTAGRAPAAARRDGARRPFSVPRPPRGVSRRSSGRGAPVPPGDGRRSTRRNPCPARASVARR